MNKIKQTKIGVYTYNNEDHNFEFTTSLTLSNKLSFVNSVVDTLIDDTSYSSIIKDEIFDFMLVRTMTDIDTSNFTLDDIEEFLSATNVVDIIKVNAEIGLIEELSEAVNKSIQYRTGIHPNPLSEALSNLLNTLEKKIDQVDLDSMMEMATKFVSMTEELNVDNIVNAYMNSDIHKKNLDEIEKAKKNRENLVKGLSNVIDIAVEKAKEDIKQKD